MNKLEQLMQSWLYETNKRRFDCLTKKEVVEHIKPVVKVDNINKTYTMPRGIYQKYIDTYKITFPGNLVNYWDTYIGNYKIIIQDEQN